MRYVVVSCMAFVAATVVAVVFVTGAEAQPEQHQVLALDNPARFDPVEITITQGDTVEWFNPPTNEEQHTMHEDDNHLFEELINPGERFRYTFTDTGRFTYHCDIHVAEGMAGVVNVQPSPLPGAPTNVTATAGDGQAVVTWSAPFAGASPITGYTVTAEPGGATVSVGGSTTTATVTGLENGIQYTFTVTATNAEGAGPVSVPSNPVTPSPGAVVCPPAPFGDRELIPPTHRTNVDCATHRGIVSGFGDNTYRPGASVRRDQMASFIARTLTAAGVELPAATGERFADVPVGSTHDDTIHRLAAAGIVSGGPGGLPANSYGPAMGVRRDQMASFLLRAAAFAADSDLSSQSPQFPDVGPNNPHFANVNGAAEAGLASGFADGTYGPAAGVRRDQMGTFVMRLFNHVEGS